ncbi:hypothetical protein [Nonomuraea rosea]
MDLDRAMAAPGDADVLNPAYDSGDHLHPTTPATPPWPATSPTS